MDCAFIYAFLSRLNRPLFVCDQRQLTVIDFIMFCKDLFLMLRPVIVGLNLFVYFLLNLSSFFAVAVLI